MFVKIESVTERLVKVTILDIDNHGALIPLGLKEFQVDDYAVHQTLKNSTQAAIFTGDDDKIIILASGLSKDELDKEKTKTINAVDRKKEKEYH
jgi:hypothetical protein